MRKNINYLRSIVTILICLVCLGVNAQIRQKQQLLDTARLKKEQREFFDRLSRKSYSRPTGLPDVSLINNSLIKKRIAEDTYKAAENSFANNDSIEGLKLLRKSADMGYAEAQYAYGCCVYEGVYMQKNVKEAYNYYIKAAKQNHPDACFTIGVAYHSGMDGFKQDSLEAFRWYKMGADNGDTMGQIVVGDFYNNAKDTINAIKYWEMACDNPNRLKLDEDDMASLAQAAYNVGYYYYYGYVVSKDETKGLNHIKLAADCGHAYSAFLLGCLYHKGTDLTPQDYQTASTYFKKSALLGFPEGEGLYGDYCQYGIGMERDSVQSIYWYKKAYHDGYTQTAYDLAWRYYNAGENDSTIVWGSKPEWCDSVYSQYIVGAAYYDKEDYDNAEIWWKKAASQNDADALWMLYVLNDCIKNDSTAGFEYLKQAADIGYPDALCDMGYNYLNGYMVNKDVEKARDYLLQASAMGNGLAFKNLGASYCNKAYIKKPDWKVAADYFRQGAEIGCPEAQYSYGYCLKKGKGVKKDKHAAIHWLKLAAQNGDEDSISELKKIGTDL